MPPSSWRPRRRAGSPCCRRGSSSNNSNTFPPSSPRASCAQCANDLRDLVLNRLSRADQDAVLARLMPDSGRAARDMSITGVPVDADRVRCPLLAITGDDDRFIPHADRRARRAPVFRASADTRRTWPHDHCRARGAGRIGRNDVVAPLAVVGIFRVWRPPTSSSRSTCASARWSKPSRFPRRASRRSSCASTSEPSSVQTPLERAAHDALSTGPVGRASQVVAAVNLGTRRIAGFMSEVLVLGAMPTAARGRAARGRSAGRQRHAHRLVTKREPQCSTPMQQSDAAPVAKGYAHPEALVSTDWLAAHLERRQLAHHRERRRRAALRHGTHSRRGRRSTGTPT